MNNDKEHNEDRLTLFSRMLTGEASSEEQKRVVELISSDSDAADEYKKLQKLWSGAGSQNYMSAEEREADWKTLQSKLKFAENRSRFGLLKIAASLALLIAVSMIFYLNFIGGDIQIKTADGSLTETLPDGTVVTLNHHSSLSYAEDFNEFAREISFEGEAYFDVATDPDKPFTIKMNETQIEVLGTQFNILNRPGKTVNLSVTEGKVRFSSENADEIFMIGESASYDRKKGKIMKRNVIDKNALAWKNRNIEFENSQLSYVTNVLESVYAVDIEVDENSAACTITVSFEEANLQDILDVLKETLSLQVNEKNDTVFITGGECN